MSRRELQTIAALLRERREELLSRWRNQVRQLPSARDLTIPALEDHIPALVDELCELLEKDFDAPTAEILAKKSAPIHGAQRHEHDFDIVEVVGEYNILRGSIHDLTERNGISLKGEPLHIVNRAIDEAIAAAMQAYSARQALETQRRRDEYLSFLAHDLRTPISAITQAARVLELISPTGDEGQFGKMVRIVRRNGENLAALVGDLLKESTNIGIADSIKPEWRRFDLWPVVESVIHELQPVSDTASTRLVNSVSEDLQVFADAALLKRVFQNLIANAITYTPNGEVVVGARQVEPNGDVECWVTDDGSGILRDQFESIFDKGVSGRKDKGGTGLGLAIVKTIVEAHGGKVTVESRPGLGSTFRFTVPAKKTN
jgi:signal transduction histidine kinase